MMSAHALRTRLAWAESTQDNKLRKTSFKTKNRNI